MIFIIQGKVVLKTTAAAFGYVSAYILYTARYLATRCKTYSKNRRVCSIPNI